MTEQRMGTPRTAFRNMLIGWTRIGSGWGARVGCLGGSIIERASTRTRPSYTIWSHGEVVGDVC